MSINQHVQRLAYNNSLTSMVYMNFMTTITNPIHTCICEILLIYVTEFRKDRYSAINLCTYYLLYFTNTSQLIE